jgi:chromosome segregation ATPase
MVMRKAKISANGQAQIEAAETALKMARQNAKAAKARVRNLKSELKVARKRYKGLRKDMRAAKRILGQVSERAAISAARPATKRKPTAPKPLARTSTEHRMPSAARKQALKKASAVQSVKSIRLVRHKISSPAAPPLPEAQALPQPTRPPVDVPETEIPSTNTTVN